MRFLSKAAFVLAIGVVGCSAQKSLAPQEPRRVLIETNLGSMVIQLSDSTPGHRDNFVKLVEEGFYEDLLFHRVIKDFMIQGGDPNSRGAEPTARLGNGGPGYTIPAEIRADHVHVKGALAAARQGDQVNPLKASSGSQFYLVHGKTYNEMELARMEERVRGNAPEFQYTPEAKEAYAISGGTPFLDMGYTVFGHVTEGINVVDSIANVQTRRGDRPLEDVWMRMIMLN